MVGSVRPFALEGLSCSRIVAVEQPIRGRRCTIFGASGPPISRIPNLAAFLLFLDSRVLQRSPFTALCTPAPYPVAVPILKIRTAIRSTFRRGGKSVGGAGGQLWPGPLVETRWTPFDLDLEECSLSLSPCCHFEHLPLSYLVMIMNDDSTTAVLGALYPVLIQACDGAFCFGKGAGLHNFHKAQGQMSYR